MLYFLNLNYFVKYSTLYIPSRNLISKFMIQLYNYARPPKLVAIELIRKLLTNNELAIILYNSALAHKLKWAFSDCSSIYFKHLTDERQSIFACARPCAYFLMKWAALGLIYHALWAALTYPLFTRLRFVLSHQKPFRACLYFNSFHFKRVKDALKTVSQLFFGDWPLDD